MTRRLAILLSAALLAAGCTTKVVKPALADALPAIWPDYEGVTVPAGIAPLDFGMADDSFEALQVRVSAPSGASLSVKGKGCVKFPVKQWRELLSQSIGDSLSVLVCAKDSTGWTQFRSFPIHVSADDIDYGLCYRLIPPGYSNYGAMGIYERDLSSFEERPVLTNDHFTGCVNCHSFNRCDPSNVSLHIRGEHGATLLRLDGEMDAYNTKTESSIGFCVYPYWHPGGRYIAYSSNATRQVFHDAGRKLIEVFDSASDVQIYDTRTGELAHPAALCGDNRWETFPAFSADGRCLFFCSAEPCEVPKDIKQVRYDLCMVTFDAGTGRVGDDPVVLLNASRAGRSISFPRPSFDGRFLMYTLSDYGNFSIWHPESDLWLLDLRTGENRRLDEVNSAAAESYHNWSSNSRWFVFGTRRDDDTFTRAYICHIDSEGRCGKPFLLPQEDPKEYYLRQMNSYNIPEFITGPVDLDSREALRLIDRTERTPFR